MRYYLNYKDMDRVIKAFLTANQSHGLHESMRAALHEAGFILEGDKLYGECKSGQRFSQYVMDNKIHHFINPYANWEGIKS